MEPATHASGYIIEVMFFLIHDKYRYKRYKSTYIVTVALAKINNLYIFVQLFFVY